MKSPVWICPDWSQLDTIWRHPLPFVLWPVGEEPLLSHWMDHAVRTGAERITLVVSDRPSEIRAHFQQHQRWSRPVDLVVLTGNEMPPAGGIPITGLPGRPAPAEPTDPAGLLDLWRQLNFAWLEFRPAEEQHIDRRQPDGGWIGARARIHPSARLIPPYRIGAGCEISADTVIGPRTIIGNRCIVGPHTEAVDSILLADTCAGERTHWHHRAADGGIILDLERHLRIDLHDDLVASRNASDTGRTGWLGRLAAGLLWLLTLPLAWMAGGTVETWNVHLPGAKSVRIKTRSRGPLLLQRHNWLKHIAAGRFTWIGILPRRSDDLVGVPDETAERLRQARPGLLALSDLHGSHSPASPLEWIHAAMQLFGEPRDTRRLILRRAFVLLTGVSAT